MAQLGRKDAFAVFIVYRVMLICANSKGYGELPKHTPVKRGTHVIRVLIIIRLENRQREKNPCGTIPLLKIKCACYSLKLQ